MFIVFLLTIKRQKDYEKDYQFHQTRLLRCGMDVWSRPYNIPLRNSTLIKP